MGILDGILGSLGGGGMTQMIEEQVASAVAAKMGIDPAMAQTAIGALTQAHPQPGDTVDTAAAQTGISPDILSQIMGHLGGEGALGQLAGAVPATGEAPAAEGGIMGSLSGMLDRDGDGNPLNDVTGMLGGMFGKK